jgi:3-hydroxybutyryl-CoA dehydratase
MSSPLFDRDFAELSVGLRHRTRGRTVTEADIVGFGTLTGDLHPQHVDARWAATSRFGERIAHGMLILSYAIGLAPLNPERVLALRRIRDATFKRPVRIGDTIHVEIAVESLAPLPDQLGLVGCAWRVRNQREELVGIFRVDALWRAAP